MSASYYMTTTSSPDMSSLSQSHSLLRALSAYDEDQGRTILTFLYLCILGFCFVMPILYYCRLYYEERHARRMHGLESAGLSAALEQSELQQQQHLHNREESRAMRRKYAEERRARILQLFTPVRMTLNEEQFQHLNGSSQGPADLECGVDNEEVSKSQEDSLDTEQNTNNDESAREKVATKERSGQGIPQSAEYDDDDGLQVRIPVQGLSLAGLTGEKQETRMVSALCSICLCNFEVGSDVVWSSNSACEHVYHTACALKWIMKQREGPLCPCCRRDFVVDPYDMEEVDDGGVVELNDISLALAGGADNFNSSESLSLGDNQESAS